MCQPRSPLVDLLVVASDRAVDVGAPMRRRSPDWRGRRLFKLPRPVDSLLRCAPFDGHTAVESPRELVIPKLRSTAFGGVRWRRPSPPHVSEPSGLSSCVEAHLTMPAYRAASATRGTVALRVAIISPYRLSIPGGVQNQVLGLARALTAHGDEVMVVAPGRPGEIDGRGLWRFVGAGRTLPVPANGSRAPVAPTPQAMWRTSQALKKFRPDVVHVHEPFVPGPSLAATLLQGAPTVATYHRAGAGRIYKALGFALRPVASRSTARWQSRRGPPKLCWRSSDARGSSTSWAMPSIAGVLPTLLIQSATVAAQSFVLSVVMKHVRALVCSSWPSGYCIAISR